MFGNYLQQMTSADEIFRCIFLGALRVKSHYVLIKYVIIVLSTSLNMYFGAQRNRPTDTVLLNIPNIRFEREINIKIKFK